MYELLYHPNFVQEKLIKILFTFAEESSDSESCLQKIIAQNTFNF